MYEIEKNVPHVKINGRTKYPFVNMEVGDSFSLSAEDKPKLMSASVSYGRANNKKFSTLKQADGSYRFWRTA